MFSIGIDLGGTNIKAVIAKNNGEILGTAELPTNASEGFDAVIEQIYRSACIASENCGILLSDISKAGLGIPGLIKEKKGPVIFAPNVGWYNVDPVPILTNRLHMPVYLGNDAACMALAENINGAGRPYNHFLMLTLGTAVGAAIVANDTLFTGFGPYGGELGHIPLYHGGHPCSCGVNGCFEQYGSANALKRLAIEAMQKNKNSSLWGMCSGEIEKLTTKQIFSAISFGDKTAITVLDEFVTYLCEGIAGLVNIFRPEVVILGGGLSNAGKPLFDRVNPKLASLTYASEYIPAPPVIQAKSGTYSGALGAAMLG